MTTDQNLTRHCLFDTALGPCGVAGTSAGRAACSFRKPIVQKTGKRLAAKQTASAGQADPPPPCKA